MGRDFRFKFIKDKQDVYDDTFNDTFNDYQHWVDVSRHNNYMINGVFSYKELKTKLKELVELVNDEEDQVVENDKDIFETISVISKLICNMCENQIINILYD